MPALPQSDLSNLNASSEWSGAALECNGRPIILYNAKHSAARNESTIMHELSHIILEHKPTINDDFKTLGLYLRGYNQIHENEATWLGGCLQIPFDGIVSALLKNRSYEDIANQFKSSIEMARFRVNKSGAQKKVYFIKRKFPR